MNIITRYKHIKHGYVRLTPTGDLLLSIPRRKRFDRGFKQNLIEKGKKLVHKHKQKTCIQREDKDSVLLRGVRIAKENLGKNYEKELRLQCYEAAKTIADIYSKKINIPYDTLRIKRLRSKRGSCSSKQNININLDLVYLPKKFLEYVVIHEVCHLKHKHHQQAFRDQVAVYMPGYKAVQKELRNISFTEKKIASID